VAGWGKRPLKKVASGKKITRSGGEWFVLSYMSGQASSHPLKRTEEGRPENCSFGEGTRNRKYHPRMSSAFTRGGITGKLRASRCLPKYSEMGGVSSELVDLGDVSEARLKVARGDLYDMIAKQASGDNYKE